MLCYACGAEVRPKSTCSSCGAMAGEAKNQKKMRMYSKDDSFKAFIGRNLAGQLSSMSRDDSIKHLLAHGSFGTRSLSKEESIRNLLIQGSIGTRSLSKDDSFSFKSFSLNASLGRDLLLHAYDEDDPVDELCKAYPSQPQQPEAQASPAQRASVSFPLSPERTATSSPQSSQALSPKALLALGLGREMPAHIQEPSEHPKRKAADREESIPWADYARGDDGDEGDELFKVDLPSSSKPLPRKPVATAVPADVSLEPSSELNLDALRLADDVGMHLQQRQQQLDLQRLHLQQQQQALQYQQQLHAAMHSPTYIQDSNARCLSPVPNAPYVSPTKKHVGRPRRQPVTISHQKLALKWRPVAKSQWQNPKDVSSCRSCSLKFGLTKRKHHCRGCGAIFCDDCTSKTVALPEAGYPDPVRVCKRCFTYASQSHEEQRKSAPAPAPAVSLASPVSLPATLQLNVPPPMAYSAVPMGIYPPPPGAGIPSLPLPNGMISPVSSPLGYGAMPMSPHVGLSYVPSGSVAVPQGVNTGGRIRGGAEVVRVGQVLQGAGGQLYPQSAGKTYSRQHPAPPHPHAVTAEMEDILDNLML